MTEITILSGKGGAGKTGITAALATVAKNAVFTDCDVDAADLHLILKPKILVTKVFEGAYVAEINSSECINCGLCVQYCRFDAIHFKPNIGLVINPLQCEGCRLCERVCPQNAITSEKSTNNFWYISDTRFGKMVHARMGPGEDNSGKLVTEVRNQAKQIARQHNLEYIITDGPPGIGCSAISALSGTQVVLLVIEPSKSGLHDAKRLLELALTFRAKIYMLINKFDLNSDVVTEIEQFAAEKSIEVLGKIPFTTDMVSAMIASQSIVEYEPESEISQTIRFVWERISSN